MKKLTKVLSVLVVLTLLISSFALFACTKKAYVQQTDPGIVFTQDDEIMADVEGKFVIDYLNALQDKGVITYVAEDSAYGKFITQINDRKADSTQGESWFVYTDDADSSDAAWGTYDYEGKTLASASFGVSSLPLKKGATYAIILSKYEPVA